MEKTIDEPKARPDVGCTELFGVSVGRVDGFRSRPAVNTDEDMVRVVLDMPKPAWRKLKKLLPANASLSLPRDEPEYAPGDCQIHSQHKKGQTHEVFRRRTVDDTGV